MLTLPGVDTLPPERLRQIALSQWHTPDDLALMMARWCGKPPMHYRVLEPSAGSGALVDAIQQVAPMPEIEAVEIDPRFAAALRARFDQECYPVDCCDYLDRPAPAKRYDLALMNPPYEGGLDGAFLAKAMDESDRVVALLRIAALCGSKRSERVWSRIAAHLDGWWMPGLAILSSRPVFSAAGEDSDGSAKSDFVCAKLSRINTSEATHVEWW